MYIYVIYIYVCVCFVCAAFFNLFIVWVFCEKHKSLRKSTMVNGEGGTWALGGGKLTGLPAKWKYCALLLLLLLDISCHSIKTVKMTKLWSACVWAKCVCKVCVAIWCDTRTRASPTHDAPSVWVLHNTRTERQRGDLNTLRFLC